MGPCAAECAQAKDRGETLDYASILFLHSPSTLRQARTLGNKINVGLYMASVPPLLLLLLLPMSA